jgi:DNA-binding LacI/PurR family transcriptional regulator
VIRPTVVDVARRAGVGRSTVSNVLRGTGRVSEATRERVLAAARELDYVPNAAARRLRGAATGTIGVHLPENPSVSAYYMEFLFGVLDHAVRHDRDVTVLTGTRPPRVDGLILSDAEPGNPLLGADVPVVTCEDVRGHRPDGVVWADHGAALTELLDTLGAARPALLVPEETTDWAARLGTAYRAWCTAHGAPARLGRIDWVPTAAGLAAAVGALGEFDALVCGPVDTAAMLLPSLRPRLRDGLLLACATDSTSCALTDPPITAIDQNPRLAGLRCAELLDDLVAGTAEPGARVEVPLRIVHRASTRPSPGSRPRPR